MQVNLKRLNDNYLFEGESASGIKIHIDNKTDEAPKGASPMELLLMAVGGCSAIDIVSILKKQRQQITDYKIEVSGEREEVKEAKPFKSIHVKVILEGDIQPEKAMRAAQLSFEKYCSVSITLEKSLKVTYDVIVNGTAL